MGYKGVGHKSRGTQSKKNGSSKSLPSKTTKNRQSKSGKKKPPNKPTIVIIGDSIIRNIQGWQLGKEVGHRVVVKSFAGATTSDMSHYVKPKLDKKPNQIFSHAGTKQKNGSSKSLPSKTTKNRQSKSGKKKPPNKSSRNSSHTLNHNQKGCSPTTVIIGDSIIRNIQGWQLGKEVGLQVVVKSFAGATTSDMSHYVKPTLDKKPNQIILHAGSNDIGKLSPSEIADNIVNLAREIESCTDAQVNNIRAGHNLAAMLMLSAKGFENSATSDSGTSYATMTFTLRT